MTEPDHIEPTARVIGRDGLDALVRALVGLGYRVVAPSVRDGAIVLQEIETAAQLPVGWTEEQDAGTYRLARRPDDAVFGFASGPQSWKRWFLPPRVQLWRAEAAAPGDVPRLTEGDGPDRPLAVLGARSCDLHAIAIQDRVFLGGTHVERDYALRRADAFVVAVQCGEPGGTCFCASTGTGPRATTGFDLALTELVDGGHRFLVEVGSDRGARVLDSLEATEASAEDLHAAHQVSESAARRMGRDLDTNGLPDLLARTLESPQYANVADRCLTCANCTMVCPTCFCTSVEEVDDLVDGSTERARVWDSCFSVDYSHIHGGAVRRSPEARYRQWLTHKFGTWVEQFGTSGCVGCGRCITWCPVGIDVTEELAAIRATEREGAHDAR